MYVRHTIAAALVAVLVIQSVSLARAATSDLRGIPREQAVQILLGNLQPGTEVRVQTGEGGEILGRFVACANDELVLASSGLRQVIPVANVVSIRRPLPPARIGNGKAFGIGAAAGVGLLMTVLFVAVADH